MNRSQFVGGMLLLLVAAVIFLFEVTSASVPVAITFTVLGVILIAISRRKQTN
ncbi:MAG: hypothetical protein HND51_22960 [Chloroflexi bacterium]|nr:hypothetical protein [Chloroflexota bacterium]